jgi:hypothetical protein
MGVDHAFHIVARYAPAPSDDCGVWLVSTTISATSSWSRRPCSPSTTRSARGCHPCLRYVLLPISLGRTHSVLAEREGFEPPIRLPVCRISSAVHSTTLPPLQTIEGICKSVCGEAVENSNCYRFATQCLWSRVSLPPAEGHRQHAQPHPPAFREVRGCIDPA